MNMDKCQAMIKPCAKCGVDLNRKTSTKVLGVVDRFYKIEIILKCKKCGYIFSSIREKEPHEVIIN